MMVSKHLIMAAGMLLLQLDPLSAQTLPRGSGWGATMVIEPVIIAHGGFNLRPSGIEMLQRAGIPFRIAPVSIKHVEVNEIRKNEASGGLF